MTINETIVSLRESASKSLNYEWQREQYQLANWLEELVMLRLDKCMLHMPERLQLVENGYNKALNDFLEACSNQSTTMYGQRYVDMRNLKEIAEQLKFRRSTNE